MLQNVLQLFLAQPWPLCLWADGRWAYLVPSAPNPVVHAVWKEFWAGLVLLCHWKAPGAAALIA